MMFVGAFVAPGLLLSLAVDHPSLLPSWLSFIGVVVTAVASIIAARGTRKNRKRIVVVDGKMDDVHETVNGKSTKLLAERDAARDEAAHLRAELNARNGAAPDAPNLADQRFEAAS